jgi:hypothetical protein
MLASDPKVGGPPVRLAGSPKTATLPVRPIAPRDDRDRCLARSLEPKLQRVVPAASDPEGPERAPVEPEGSTVPVRFTRRCSVSGYAVVPPKRRDGTSAQPRRAGTGGSSEAPSASPRSKALRTEGRSLDTDFAHARRRGTSVRHSSTTPKGVDRTPSPRRVTWAARTRRCGPVAPILPAALEGSASGQTDIVSMRNGQVPKAEASVPPGVPDGRRADARASGARSCPRSRTSSGLARGCASATAAPKCPWPERAEARPGLPGPKPERRSFRVQPKQHLEP